MDEKILKKLEQRMDRRSFLRGSGLAAAVIAGVTAFPQVSFTQDQSSDQDKNKPQEAKKDDKAAGSEKAKGDKKEETKDGKKEEEKNAKNTTETPDPFKETKKDEQGRDYRLCPQCGYNMYKQDGTWSCENCGYSYVE